MDRLRQQRLIEQAATAGNTTLFYPEYDGKAADVLSARQVVDLGWPLVENQLKQTKSFSIFSQPQSSEEHWLVVEQVLRAACEISETRVAQDCLSKIRNEFGAKSCRVRSLHALLMESEGLLDKAMTEYRSLLEEESLINCHQSPTNSALAQWIRKRLIVCQMEQRQPIAEIVKSLSAYLSNYMSDTEAWEQLFQIYFGERHYEQAAYCMEELITLRPSNWGYYLKYAEACFMLGDWQMAKKYFCRVIDFNPGNIRAAVGVKKCLKQANNGKSDAQLDQLVTDRLRTVKDSAAEFNSLPEELRDAIKIKMLDLARIDQLAVEYLQFTGTIIQVSQLSPTGANLYNEVSENQLELQSLRQMFKQGKIDQAVELINAKYPQFLQQNAEVNFKLHRQCFVEHLRGCTDPRQALHYLKSEMPADLAAAHDSEWRQLSLMLLYKEQTRDSPVADEWQLSKRHELAKLILPRLERFLAIAEPPLSLYLRYLCLAHNMYYALRAEISPIQDDLDRLISPAEESEESGTLSSSSEQLRFDETDVFTLAQIMGLAPDAARAKIQAFGGSVGNALVNCLTLLLRTDSDLLSQLTTDYCEYRGLLSEDFRSGKDSFITGQQRQQLARVNSVCDHLTAISDSIQRSRSRSNVQSMGEIVQEIVSLDPMFAENSTELYFTLQRWHLVELIKINEYHKALQLAKNDLASLSLRHPELVNPFKEIALMLIYPPQLLATDSVSNNSGKSKIKAITDAWTRATPETLAGPVSVALTSALGIKEPRLLKILNNLLEAHSKWFKQQSAEDRFADIVGIATLVGQKLPSLSALAAISPNGSSASTSFAYDSQFCDASELAEARAEATESGIKDEDITALQDILACTSIEAIRLLQRHGGRLTEALAVIFGE